MTPFFVVAGVLVGCVSDDLTSHVVFRDVASEAGLDYVQAGPDAVSILPAARSVSGGAAVGDYDADGLPDIYATRIDGGDVLYRNLGNGRFEDVTARAGLVFDAASNGAAFGDVDNDGDLDLFVAAIYATRYYLFINDGAGAFTEEGVERNAAVVTALEHQGWSVSFGDYDRDGWLDTHLNDRQEVGPMSPRPSHTRLLRNLGVASPGHFEDVTIAAGVVYDDVPSRIPVPGSHAFMSTFADMDDDTWPDLLVTADFGQSRLFWNDGDGTFTDGTEAAGVGTDEFGMGSAVADFDGDGRLDWFVDSIWCSTSCSENVGRDPPVGNRLYQNRGERTFDDVTEIAGVHAGHWAWGTAAFDYDNDGDMDIVQTNGVAFLSEMYSPFWNDPLVFFENRGDGTFVERARDVGLVDDNDGAGLMVLDYDDDGDLDVFIVEHAGPPSLWRNDGGNENAWCRVRLAGRTNRHGIGARVYFQADAGGPEQVQELRASGAYLGQNEMIAHFGMGPGVRPAHRIRVRWPTTASEQVLTNVECNRTVVIDEP